MDLMLSSLLDDMASERKTRPKGRIENIDETARLDIIARMSTHKPPLTNADLARACNVTPAAISLLLSRPIPARKTRGCKFWPALSKAIGISSRSWSSVAVVDNDEALRRAERVLKELDGDADALENWLRGGELLVKKR